MKRLTFLFGLLGAAVAKGQETTTLQPDHESDFQVMAKIALKLAQDNKKLMQEQIDLLKLRLKPKSGHCPLDGTKGEPYQIEASRHVESHNTSNGFVNTEQLPVYALRCPHCGMLFTETEKGRTE